jgi:hypothetical protein
MGQRFDVRHAFGSSKSRACPLGIIGPSPNTSRKHEEVKNCREETELLYAIVLKDSWLDEEARRRTNSRTLLPDIQKFTEWWAY